MHTIIEPFRVKMTEALPITTRGHREACLASTRNNVFLLDAEDITIDLLTDSGTGALSARQWAALMLGDESYAGSTSWHRFENTVREITGFKHIFPVHQGRAAERILAATRLKPGAIVPNNSHFDTTRANFEYSGAQAVDLLTPEGEDIYSETRFKGNMDIGKLAHIIRHQRAREYSFLHDYRDEQRRWRAARFHGKYQISQGDPYGMSDSPGHRLLPLCRKFLLYQGI